MPVSSYPLKKSLLFACLTLFGCAPAASIQDLGWEQQSAISTPAIQAPQEDQFKMLPAPQQGTEAIIGQPAFKASFGSSMAEGQKAIEQQSMVPQPKVIPYDPQKTRVALLVPLSGPHAVLGQAMANAAQLAVFDMGVNNFELLPRDTKGTPHGAVRAARDALASGSQLIIGPLFAANVSAVKPTILASRVNMLGLSTDMSLAGPRCYMMGFAPGPQIERLVSYAIDQGLRRFATMIPPGPYGLLVRKSFKEAVARKGGVIVIEDLRGDVAPIVAQKENIDALFIPYGGGALRRLAGKPEQAGLTSEDNIQLLGTGLWDAPNVAGGQDLLINGWYAAPEPELHASFTEGYEASFGKAPPRLATIAYDATALAVVLARNELRYDQNSLQMRTGFAGVDGLFRLLPNGHIERGLAINKITFSGSQVIDASPKTFVKTIMN